MRTIGIFLSFFLLVPVFRTANLTTVKPGSLSGSHFKVPDLPIHGSNTLQAKVQQNDTTALKQSDWYQAAIKNIEASEYQFHGEKGGKLFKSFNRKQQLQGKFSADAFVLKPRVDVAGDWQMKLRVKGIYSGNQPVYGLHADPVSTQQGNDLMFSHGDEFSVEYINNEEGVRQNFIIQKQPEDNPVSLAVHLEVNKDWKIHAVNNQELKFSTAPKNENPVYISYSSLKAWDANHKSLPAYFAVRGNEISIEVQTKDVVYPVTIDPLSTTASWTVESNQPNAQVGRSLCSAGDVNGDGFSDVLISAYYYDGLTVDCGVVNVYMGAATGLSPGPSRSYAGVMAGEWFGFSVSTAGDVNKDGYSDVVIGSPWFSSGQTNEGRITFYYGSATGLPAAASLLIQSDVNNAQFGQSVACAGDVNGDGYSDIIAGAPKFTTSLLNDGKVFLYAGSATGINTTPLWSHIGEQSGAYYGAASELYLGNGVSSAGDVNGDGYDDVLVAAPLFMNTLLREGKAYLYTGSATGLSANAVWTYIGGEAQSMFANSISSAGDINGDGYGDVVIGQYGWDGGIADQGRVLLFLGSISGLSVAPFQSITGFPGANVGSYVNCAGDVNGDGLSDIIIGAASYNSNQGAALVYMGAEGALLGPGPAWFVSGPQAGCKFGICVASAGDVNGDGFSDILVGASAYDNPEADEGRVYLYQGSPDMPLTQPSIVLQVDQIDCGFGNSVASAGDVNGDGYSDVIIGAPLYDNPLSNEGAVFIFHGNTNGISYTPTQIIEADILNVYFGFSVSSAGDINGDGYSDIVVGATNYSSNLVTDYYEGALYVYHGSPAGVDPVPACMLQSNKYNAQLGISCSSAGDVNGDGYSDILGGAPGYGPGVNNPGAALLWMGSSNGITNLYPVVLTNNVASSGMGQSVSGVGDLNGDGFGDIAVGAPYYQNGQSLEGAVYVYYGSGAGINTSPSVLIESNEAGALFGNSVSGAGDINGDGFGDLIVGAPAYDNLVVNDGAALIYMGSVTGVNTVPAAKVGSGVAGSYSGFSVSTAGDINGDGYSDVLVGAPEFAAGQVSEGFSGVFLGRPVGLNTTASFSLQSNQAFWKLGYNVAALGDVNGDGYSDIGSAMNGYSNPESLEGGCYIHYGNSVTSVRANLRLYNSDLVTPIQQANMYDPNLFGIGLYAKSFTGRTRAKLVWQTIKNGQPFTGNPITNSVAFTAEQANYVMLGLNGTEIKNAVAKQVPTKATYVRARVKYDPSKAITGQIYGPWRYPDGFMRGRRDVGSVALPLQIISFTAVKEGTAASLAWKTTQEEPGVKYAVERSSDGIHFTQLELINGQGNPENNYTRKDISPVKGKNYYRIKAIEPHKISYTAIRMLDFSGIADMLVFPNPVKAGREIQITNLPLTGNPVYSISLINMNGQVVWKKSSVSVSGMVVLKLTDVPAGNYLLQVAGGREQGAGWQDAGGRWQQARKIIVE